MLFCLLVIELIVHRQHISVFGRRKDLKNTLSKALPWMMSALKILATFLVKITLKNSLLVYVTFARVKGECIRKSLIFIFNAVQIIHLVVILPNNFLLQFKINYTLLSRVKQQQKLSIRE